MREIDRVPSRLMVAQLHSLAAQQRELIEVYTPRKEGGARSAIRAEAVGV